MNCKPKNKSYIHGTTMPAMLCIVLFFIMILGANIKAVAQYCPANIDFEMANTTNWVCYSGVNNPGPTWSLTTTTPAPSLHTITTAGTDFYGGFSTVGDGTFSIKIGKDTVNRNADGVSYTLHVPPGGGDKIMYRYAIVLQDPGHTSADQPRFEISVTDSATGLSVSPCYPITFLPNAPGFTLAPVGTITYYRDWTASTLDLRGLGGKTVVISFKVGGCTTNSHWGYAYVDMNCGIANTLNGCTSGSTTLTAPTGYLNYAWTDSVTYTANLGTTRIVSIPSPTTTTTYAAILTPFAGYGCTDTIYTRVVAELPAPITGTTNVCSGLSTSLSSTTAGGLWSTGSTIVAVAGSSTGLVSGISAGTTTVTYTLPTGCNVTSVVTVNPLPAAISGSKTLCPGSSGTLTNATPGGNWTSGNTGIVSVNAATGHVTGISVGTTDITYTLSTGCMATTIVTVSLPAPAISGAGNACTGSSVTLSNGTTGGTWASSNTAIAAVGTGGIVTGISTGSTTVTYTFNTGCFVTKAVTVNPSPSAITGPSATCESSSVTLSDATTGGTWSTNNTVVATINPTSGIITGMSAGTSTVTYTVASGCTATRIFNVSPLPGPIGGASVICIGLPTTLTNSATGGTWSSSATSVSIVGTSGIATGISGGTSIISYTLPTGCRTTKLVTVSVSPAPINGFSAVCPGSSITLSNPSPGGSWLSNTPTVASVGTSSGVVDGFVVGTTTITYTIPSGCYSTKTINVPSLPAAFAVLTPGGVTNYCAGGPGIEIGLSGSSTGSLSYQLYVGATLIGAPVAGTGAPINFGYQTAGGTYKITATDAVTGCVANMANTVNIISNPTPTVYSVFGGGNYCSGGSGLGVNLAGSDLSIDYRLYQGVSPVGSVIPGTGSSLSFGLQTLTGYYSVIATNPVTGCSDTMAGIATIIADPLPLVSVVTGGGRYCGVGAGPHVGLSSSTSGVNYRLFKNGVFSGVTIVGTGTALDFGPKTSSGVYTIEAVNPATGCTNTMSGSATIITGTNPVVYTVTGLSSYCAGGAGVPVNLSGSNTGVNYQLYISGVPSGIPLAGTGAALSFGMQTAAATYTVQATNATTGCNAAMVGSVSVTIAPLPTAFAVTGGGTYCSGGTGMPVGLSSSAPGFNYRLYNGTTPVGSAIPGTGSSINFGLQTTAGTYTVLGIGSTSGCTNSMASSATVIVQPLVTPLVTFVSSPGDTVCPGTAVSYVSTSVNGGAAPTYVWKVNGVPVSTSGTVYSHTPANGDIVSITMTSSASCLTAPSATSSHTILVNYMPVITGSKTVCVGEISSLSNTTTGGTWTSSDMSVATIATIGSSTGVTSGLSAGTTSITYMMATGCYAYTTLTVLPLPAIAATSAASCGGVTTLTGTGGTSYSWSPAIGLACSTCTSTTVAPSATTTFTVTGTDAAGCNNTHTITVSGDRIFGRITFGASRPDTTDTKVWLMQFNPMDSSVVAVDSALSCSVDTTIYYEFNSKPTGNYLVKAKLLHGNVTGVSGYLPTYGISSPHWYEASSVTHTTGSDEQPVVIVYSTVAPGTGSIAGNVYAGAGKGTTGEAPATGMLVYLKDFYGNILTHTYTNDKGAYSFDGIAFGDYVVYPEEYGHYTTGSEVLTLNNAMPKAADVLFKQYTTSRTIKPYITDVSVKSLAATSGLNIFPNPSAGTLNIQWTNHDKGSAIIAIVDMAGREVFHSVIDINNKTTITDLNNLNNGIYLLSITSTYSNYTGKLLIQK